MKPGQDLVIGGFIGIEGTVYAAEHWRKRLEKTLPEDLLDTAEGFRRELDRKPEAAAGAHCREAVFQPVGEGGVFAALWNLAEIYRVGFTVYLRKIPVHQETIEICEALELNPYELRSGGCVLLAADNGNDLSGELERAGIRSAVIGKITGNNDRMILNGEHCGYLNRPRPDAVQQLKERER